MKNYRLALIALVVISIVTLTTFLFSKNLFIKGSLKTTDVQEIATSLPLQRLQLDDFGGESYVIVQRGGKSLTTVPVTLFQAAML